MVEPDPVPAALDRVVFDRRAAFVPEAGTLVIADVHLGRDWSSSVELPLGERADVVRRVTDLLDRFSPERVVVAGDLLHRFDRVPDPVARTLDELKSLVRSADAALIVTPGNHDGMLAPLFHADDRPAEYELDGSGILLCHGHRRPDGTAPVYLIGHDHPAISIEGRKRPCFLWARSPVDDAVVIALPAFNRLTVGVDIAKTPRFDSPLLPAPDACHPIVFDRDRRVPLRFPALGTLRSFL